MINMSKLTKKQIEILPALREYHANKKSEKSNALVQIIDKQLAESQLSSTDSEILKIAVQIYQSNEKQKRLNNRQRQIDYAKKQAKAKELTREKIILGACSQHVSKTFKSHAFFDLLFACANNFLSERDFEFMKTRYNLKKVTEKIQTRFQQELVLNSYFIEDKENNSRHIIYEKQDVDFLNSKVRYYALQKKHIVTDEYVNAYEIKLGSCK